ncbi:MAG: archease [Candidatus Micrarchaeota archaeon]|nr:archease [Candidatus Micrarchaeota archaeon]
MPKGYRYVDHTADVEYIATGATVEKAFTNAFMGLFATMSDVSKVKAQKSVAKPMLIKESAKSMEDLLWYSLQDALSAADATAVFPFGVKGLKITKKKGKFWLEAGILCKDQVQKHGRFDIKGISRYDLAMKNTGKGYSVSVVVDV